MEASITPLAALSLNSDRHTILVRVTRMWEAVNKRTGAPLHTNVVLLDEKQTHMIAVIRNNQKQIYLPKLKEEEIYAISNFKLVPAPKQYKAVDADYSINFLYKTKIEKWVASAIIPLYKFELKPFPEVKNLVGNVAMLIDVLGMVKSYGKPETRNNGAQKIDVILTDHKNEIMLVTLWEDRVVQLQELLSPFKNEPVFVVTTGLLAKKFSTAASLSGTDATRCYANIDYAPLTDLKKALATTIDGKQGTLTAPTVEQFVTSTGETIQELPISSILKTVIPPEKQLVRCICRAQIVDVLGGNGWYYNCCPTCARAPQDMNGKYYCLACNEDIESLAQRFRIVVRVEDPTGTTTVTLFNKEAEQLVGVPLQKILVAQSQDQQLMEAIPPVVRNIIGKHCAFQLKITPYNIIQGCEEYTVSRVYEVPSLDTTTSMVPNTKFVADPIGGGIAKKQKLT
ncbi:hypothetical protein POM88_013891 [Heracleum sosnowskyi]|uniref:Replication factor A C-terminal domain-containing protein n=1 Tax=Heracleum sosnowskyi TaxID=360622 RepID=A0AAD8IZF4_9APIA|nr:hypothetical protein POM88_013891 [Heracleum sosnowskyi]